MAKRTHKQLIQFEIAYALRSATSALSQLNLVNKSRYELIRLETVEDTNVLRYELGAALSYTTRVVETLREINKSEARANKLQHQIQKLEDKQKISISSASSPPTPLTDPDT